MQGKVALCWYGLLRQNEAVSNLWLENLIKPLNIDVFACVADQVYTDPAIDPHNAGTYISYKTKLNIPAVQIKDNYLEKIYSPYLKAKNIIHFDAEFYQNKVVENQLPNYSFQQELVWRTFSMFNHIKGVLKLRQDYEKTHNVKYDLVILARPDLSINNIPSISHLHQNTVYFSGDHRAFVFYYGNNTGLISRANTLGRGVTIDDFEELKINWNCYDSGKIISDHLLLGSTDNIDKLTDIYDLLPQYHQDGVILSNETLIGYTFLKNNINYEYDNFLDHSVKYPSSS